MLPLVLWKFVSTFGREILCRVVEHPIGLELRIEYEDLPIETQAHRDTSALIGQSREWKARIAAKRWTEIAS